MCTLHQILFGRLILKNGPGGACSACVGDSRGVHMILVGKPQGKRPFRRPRYRWEDNLKLDLQDVGHTLD